MAEQLWSISLNHDHTMYTETCMACGYESRFIKELIGTREAYERRNHICMKSDMVNQPPHYRQHPSGVECIQVTEHLNFCIGNAIKYLWRCDEKGSALEDLKKARWYIDREIQRREHDQ